MALYDHPAPDEQPVAWVDLLKEADQIVKNKPTWKSFIDGTPLSNDIAVWMADFAQEYASPPPVADVQPVAWMNVFDDVNRGSFEKPGDTHLRLDEAKRQIERHKARGLCALRTIPLYAHPPAADVQELERGVKYLRSIGWIVIPPKGMK
jgi:hypothetical protein